MPLFCDRLSETAVASAVAYIKSTWPAQVQECQAQMSQAWEGQVGVRVGRRPDESRRTSNDGALVRTGCEGKPGAQTVN